MYMFFEWAKDIRLFSAKGSPFFLLWMAIKGFFFKCISLKCCYYLVPSSIKICTNAVALTLNYVFPDLIFYLCVFILSNIQSGPGLFFIQYNTCNWSYKGRVEKAWLSEIVLLLYILVTTPYNILVIMWCSTVIRSWRWSAHTSLWARDRKYFFYCVHFVRICWC